jgi:hypothetical protein
VANARVELASRAIEMMEEEELEPTTLGLVILCVAAAAGLVLMLRGAASSMSLVSLISPEFRKKLTKERLGFSPVEGRGVVEEEEVE